MAKWHSCNICVHKHFKSGDLCSKLANHATKVNHLLDFENIKLTKSNCNNYKIRIFLERWFTSVQKSALNKA